MAALPPEVVERFHARLASTPTGAGCIEWCGVISDSGRGLVTVGRRKWQAHRVAYELATGQPPPRTVAQSCRNPRCVNPKHLQGRDAAPRRRPNRNNRCSGVLHIHPAAPGWRAKQTINGQRINTRVHPTIPEAAEALAKALAAAGVA